MTRHPLIFCVFFIALWGCRESLPTPASHSTQSALDKIKAKGSIRIGYANEAPYAYYDPQRNRLTGEAPEIARLILKRIGVSKIEGVLTEFGALIPGLKAKRFDIIAAGMYITPERCKEAAFSNPTYGVGEGFIVKKNNPKQLHGYEDIAKNKSTKLGVVAGTIEIKYAKTLGIPKNRLVIFPDTIGALSGVQTGRIDAFAATSLTVQNLIQKANDKTIERSTPFEDPIINGKEIIGYGAFVLRKEDKSLLNRFNAELENFIGSQEHLATVKPFGFTKRELPGKITAEEICASKSKAI